MPGGWGDPAAVPRSEAVRRAEAVAVARAFHDSYEAQAPIFGYETRRESAVAWADVPRSNRELMTSVAADLLERGVIEVPLGSPAWQPPPT